MIHRDAGIGGGGGRGPQRCPFDLNRHFSRVNTVTEMQ